MIASVIIDIKNKQVNKSFDYNIPNNLLGVVKLGARVRVNFANKIRVAFVIEIKEETDYSKNLKDIEDVIDINPIINEEGIEIAKYISNNNFTFMISSLENLIPRAFKIKYQTIVTKLIDNDLTKSLFGNKKELIFDNMNDDKKNLCYQLLKDNSISFDTRFKQIKEDPYEVMIHLVDDSISCPSKKSSSLLDYLSEINQDIEEKLLIADSGYSKAVIDTLESIGAISKYKKEIIESNEDEYIKEYKKVPLNQYQKNAIEAIKMDKYDTYLIHGVTGSGKTNVYMELIEDARCNNKSSIMLVPEISLTPQITDLFKSRFKNRIAILHSRLSIKEKYNEWKRILAQEVDIVIGARSAIFAPLKNLGCIIVDEEHESTYKQENNPKYSAIDIARLRAKKYDCPLVLGSATPDVSDYFKACEGEYKLIEMPFRANMKPFPESEIVDMRQELKNGNKSVFSLKLKNAIIENYNNHNQTILFINRRGHSSFVMCRSCGEVVKCPHCDVSLTFHKRTNTLKCHYCGYEIPNPVNCPKCGSEKIRYLGTGTEKVMEELTNILPDARCYRMDMDTTKKMEDYEAMYQGFKAHDYDILVGTKMITKGLDFPLVTLVGIINADLALNYPLYNASSEAFNLIMQVSGRGGRAEKDGRTIIQTYNPNHFVIEASKINDYDHFYKNEIKYRRIQHMPPFSEALMITISSFDANLAYEEAKIIATNLKKASIESKILGPVEADIFKKNDIFYFKIQVLAYEDSVLDMVKYLYPKYQSDKNVTLDIERM